MKRILLFGTFLSAALLFSVSSCKKDTPDTETQSATDNSLCEGEFNRVVPEANGIAIGEPGVNGNKMLPGVQLSCPVDSVDPQDTLNGWPNTLYIKYGTSCTCSDGKTRAGTLRCVFDTGWDSPTPSLTIYLENYYVNGVHFEGNVVVSKNTAARTFTQTINNGKCSKTTPDNTWEILYNCTRTMQWSAGYNTVTDPTDDVFLFSGSATGTNRDGKTFSVNVTAPIEKRGNCRYITKGTFDITPEGKDARTVDFGDGTCDDKATLKIKNNTFTFSLD